MRNNNLLIFFILVVNIIVYSGIFLYINSDKKTRANFLVKEQMSTLKTHYDITTTHFGVVAESTVDLISNDPMMLALIESYLNESESMQDILREQLYERLIKYYRIIQQHGVLQFHFVSPENITILRVHKPEKHSDDLTDIKYSFRYVNETKKAIRGIEGGKTSVSFRDVHPLYSQEGRYLGCVDVAFSPEKVQESLLDSSDIYTHLIFHESVLSKHSWKRSDKEVYFTKSTEHPEYFEYSLTRHDESFQKSLIDKHQERVIAKIEKKEDFAIISELDGEQYIVAFLAIKNIKQEVVGFLTSYTQSTALKVLYRDFYVLNIMILLVMTFMSYFIYKAMKSRMELEEEKDKYQTLSLYDPLTKLPNRLLLQERLLQYIANAKRHESKFALLFIDLDNFKYINDTYGHKFGDEVLKIVSNKVSSLIRDVDLLARLGGDEFVLIVEELDRLDNSAFVAKKVIDLLKEPIIIEDTKHYLGASIGISIYPDDSTDSLDLLKFADIAMYKAKDAGKNNVQFYSPEMTESIMGKVQLEHELRDAIKHDQFIVHYQPQIDADTQKLTGMEALVRWKHPQKGIVSPFSFIDFAEESGLIIKIDRLVMRRAIKQFAKWYHKGYEPGILSLNLSVKQLQEKDYFDFLAATLQEFGLQKESLGLEVTEGQIMKSPEEAIAILHRIHDLGIQLSIDDFGTGYSSLSYLKRLPIDKLKIDQSFIRELPDDEEDAAISKAIIALAKSLKLDVIAEGVETELQERFLLAHGCKNIQGYLYSKPIPAELVEKDFLQKI